MIQCKLISSMSKVFPDRAPDHDLELKKAGVLRGEKFAFQAAFTVDRRILAPMKIEVADGPLKKISRIRRIVPVLAENLGGSIWCPPEEAAQRGYERAVPGLFPDVLTDDLEKLHACPRVWYAVWIDIEVPETFKAGVYPVTVNLYDGGEAVSATLKIEVIDAVLPPQTLKHTEWFYCDCLCHEHKTEPWTPRFWRILEKYFLNFAAHGANLLLTPIVTPSLDTVRGGERLTTQLVKIRKTGTKYAFDFTLLKKWIRLARKCGIRYFEMAHLFTQWGADATPKIIAEVNGREKRIFGWDVPAASRAYKQFLNAFLPELTAFLKAEGVADDTYFHISDEPCDANIEGYRTASDLVRPLLKGFRIMDAASHTKFFTDGLVSLPVPSESSLCDFMELDVPERWTYYCGGPELPYSNRLHSMPASANRIMGTLLYLYQVQGFLHWGYNFWNSLLSTHPSTMLGMDADQGYASGDTCLVYPGDDAPLDSMRGEVFFHGLQDLRALQLLEKLTSRKKVLALIRRAAGGRDPKMNDFPLDQAFLHKMREAVNAAIGRAVSAK